MHLQELELINNIMNSDFVNQFIYFLSSPLGSQVLFVIIIGS